MHTSAATVFAPVATLVVVQHDTKMFSQWLNIVCANIDSSVFFKVGIRLGWWGWNHSTGQNSHTSASVNNAKTSLLIDVAVKSERVNALTSWRGRFTQVRMSFRRLKMRFMAGKRSRRSGIAARLVVLNLGVQSMVLKSPTLFQHCLDKLRKRFKTDSDINIEFFWSLLIRVDKLSRKLYSQ